MDMTDVATGIGILGSASVVISYAIDLKIKPVINRLKCIEKQNKDLHAALNFITDGLLTNDQIPKQK